MNENHQSQIKTEREPLCLSEHTEDHMLQKHILLTQSKNTTYKR